MRIARVLPLVLLIAGSAVAQTPASRTITIGTIDSIWSPTLKEKRQIQIYTPPSYRDSVYLPRKYPVLYLLDGDAHFHSVTGLIQILGTGVNGTYVVPEMIVVAIPNTDRTRDMTPTHVTGTDQGIPSDFFKTSGGMPNFFQFIKGELIPYIDSAYRTMPYRVFVGHSLGGITVINALYTIPETFNAYLAIDPSLWWDKQVLLRQAKTRLHQPTMAKRALYLAQANTINPDDTTSNTHYSAMVQFNGVVEAYNPHGLRYAYRYYPDDSHGSIPISATYDALRFFFADFQPQLGLSMADPLFIKEHFAKVSSQLGVEFRPPESMIDLLSQFQIRNDTAKAVTLLELNTELYPGSPHAHQALGAAWQSRDKEKALRHYERALALKPGNATIQAAIAKLKGK